MLKCFWIKTKECKYFDESKPFDRVEITKKPGIAMLNNFDIKEICEICLLATKIELLIHR